MGVDVAPPSLCRVKTAMLFHENGIYIFPIDWNILLLDSELLHAYRKFSSESFEIVPEDFLKYQLFGKLNEPAVLNVFRVIHGNALSFTNRMYGLLEKLFCVGSLKVSNISLVTTRGTH